MQPCARVEIDEAAEVNGEAEPGAGGQVNRAATGGGCGLDGGVDGGAIEDLAGALGAVGADIEEQGGFCRGGGGEGGEAGEGEGG